MEIITVEQMRKMDAMSIHELGLPGLILMEHAALQVANYLKNHFSRATKMIIFCGPGNNGGDGFALARLLDDLGYANISIYCCVEKAQMSKDEAIQYAYIKQGDIPIYTSQDLHVIETLLDQHEVFIDALFGTGLSRMIDGFYQELIEQINEAKKYVVSIDIASGIHGDTGNIMGAAIKADVTITFECLKYGQMQSFGRRYSGTLLPVAIGMAKQAKVQYGKGITVLDEDIIKQRLPKRGKFTHKGSFGKGLMIGGSTQMSGAITLCAQAALRSGIGTLTLFVPESIREVIASNIPECMLLSAPHQDGFFAKKSLAYLKEHMDNYDFITIGNGLGRTSVAEEMVCMVLESELPCILDGDALYLAGKHQDVLKKRNACTIVTPHPKELSYLSGKSREELQAASFLQIIDFMKDYPHLVMIAKDTYTFISDGEQMYLNTLGNNGLAKGGSGDVLCGIISGLFAQSKDALASATSGVYLHALAAQQLAQTMDTNSFLPSDILSLLPTLYKAFRF